MRSCIPIGMYGHSNSNLTIDEYNFTHTVLHEQVSILTSTAQPFYNNSTKDAIVQQILLETIENIIYRYITPIIGFLGCIGNVMNLIVLTRKSVTVTMNRMEKSSHSGLTALAISDLLFCLIIIPHLWVPTKQFSYESFGFDIIYAVYSEALINIFIMSSTWLTVIISFCRYLAVVHPLKAREITGMTFTIWVIVATFIICFLFNLPRFWNEKIESILCEGGLEVYYRDLSYFKLHVNVQFYYSICYFIIVICIPVCVLIYCNIFLIKSLKRSLKMREKFQPAIKKFKDSSNRLNFILIVIMVMYILLVVPGDSIKFIKTVVTGQKSPIMYFNLIVSILNLFQALNFSFNFFLYCIVNVHFRKTMLQIFCPRKVYVDKSNDLYTVVNARNLTTSTRI